MRFIKYYSEDQLEENETQGIWSTYGRREQMYTRFWGSILKQWGHLKDLKARVEDIIDTDLKQTEWEGV